MGASAGKNKSNQSSEMSQDVWGGQSDALQGLYGNAENLFGQNSQYGGQLNDIAQNLMPMFQQINQGAMGGMQGQLGGGAYGDAGQIRDKLFSSMGQPSATGQMYQDIVGGPGNTYIDPMVDAMRQSGNQQLDRMQSGTGLDAAAMGQGGSNRHAMQNAMQGAQVAQDMSQQEANMRGTNYATDMDWKMKIANQADQSGQMEQDRLMNMLGGANQSQQMGMGFGGQMQNLGMGMQNPWMNAQNQGWNAMNQYANTIGAPTVLSQGGSRGSSKGGGASVSAKG